jgi:hypothetical protein
MVCHNKSQLLQLQGSGTASWHSRLLGSRALLRLDPPEQCGFSGAKAVANPEDGQLALARQMVDSAFPFRVAKHELGDGFSLFKEVVLQVCHGKVSLLEGLTARTTKRPARGRAGLRWGY